MVLDEWQRLPEIWDRVRRAVDADPTPGRFLLTGSSSPAQAPVHTEAERIVNLRMRPLSLVERSLETPTVSLAALMSGTGPTTSRGAPRSPWIGTSTKSSAPACRACATT